MGILVDGRGAFSGLVFTMMADFSDMALIEAAVEEENSTANRVRVLGSVLFYGTVIGSVYHSLNMISGTFRGALASEDKTSRQRQFLALTC